MDIIVAGMPGLVSAGVGWILWTVGLIERLGADAVPPTVGDFSELTAGTVALRGRWQLAADGWELVPIEGEAEPVRVVGPLTLSAADDGVVGEARGELRVVQGGPRHPFREGLTRRARVLVVRRSRSSDGARRRTSPTPGTSRISWAC